MIKLLAIIALAELYRIYLLLKPVTKKGHFKNKLKGTRQMRWDLEFKVAKTLQIREDIRKEYDYMNSRIATLDEQLKLDLDAAQRTKTEEQKTLAEKDRERLLGQIKNLDLEVYGSAKSQEHPNGQIGLNHNIESLLELEGMLKKYIKSI